jgi:hypothetical protein
MIFSLFKRRKSSCDAPDKAWFKDQFSTLRTEMISDVVEVIRQYERKYDDKFNEVDAKLTEHEIRIKCLEKAKELKVS